MERIGVILLFVLSLGCGKESGPAAPVFFPPPSVSSDDPTWTIRQKVFELTNSFRTSNGAPALNWDAQLAFAAQGFAEEMVTLGFFSHISPDGTTAGTRIREAGYDWSTWGENIAYGYATAEAVVQGWIQSSGHRANMLNQKFRDLGIGYSLKPSLSKGKDTPHWVQAFGAK